MKKALAKVRQERDDYQRKSEDLERYADEIAHRDKVINELQEKITALTDELFHERNKVQELQGLYAQETNDLRKESVELNQINKKLVEELTLAHRSPVNGAQNPLIESLRARISELVKENTQLKLENERKRSPTRGDAGTRNLHEIERENQYLHQMIKNMVKDDILHRPDYSLSPRGYSHTAKGHPNISLTLPYPTSPTADSRNILNMISVLFSYFYLILLA